MSDAEAKKLSDNMEEFDATYFSQNLSDGTHALIQEEHNFILKVMPPQKGERILDVGCGKGRLEKFLTAQEPGVDMVSSDVTSEAQAYIRGTFVLCSMSDMPFPDSSFDKIFCQQVLSHFKDGGKGIEEAFRVLKKGGKLMVLTPNKYYVYVLRAAALLHLIPKVRTDKTARWLYSKRTLRKLFKTRDWDSIALFYFQRAPKKLSFDWLRPKIITVARK